MSYEFGSSHLKLKKLVAPSAHSPDLLGSHLNTPCLCFLSDRLCFLLHRVENVTAGSQPSFSLLVGEGRGGGGGVEVYGEKKLAGHKGQEKTH